MHSAKKQKVASFYSKSLPRPTVLLDQDDNPIRDRVDAPEPVTGALLGKQITCLPASLDNIVAIQATNMSR